MFYSSRLNLLFIAAPKTGSTTVERVMSTLDPDGSRWRITLENRTILSSCVKTASLGHATAREFRQALGDEVYDSLSTFGFVRDPLKKIVSAYFFNKQRSFGKLFKRNSMPMALFAKRAIQGVISISAARTLPLHIWAALYPMKKCSDYFLDSSGKLIVDFLGSTERLSEDLTEILSSLGIRLHSKDVPHLNKSKRNRSKTNIRPGVLYNFLAKRYADDLYLYSLVETGILDTRQQARPENSAPYRGQAPHS